MLRITPSRITGEMSVKSLTIAMPAYNEAENIQVMIEETAQAVSPLVEDFEIIVVDDGSQDETAVIVQALMSQYPQLRLLRHEENMGYGTAVFHGLIHASKDLIFFTDADRQFDLREIEKLLAEINQADLVVGYRAPRRDPFMRRLNGRGWSGLVTLLFGYTARDIDCAFKLMRRQVVDALRDEITSGGATFSAEFLVRAKRAGFHIAEAPITGHRPRVAGNPTGARPNVILRAFRELMALRLQLWRGDNVAGKRLVERETAV